ncbi:hypothetical protein RB195_014663 [Necator americanus]|uniref:Uncharacterized protein n=1 Tax=Necator americanus TaxID=51031 RepID=A0ABR1E147_NECAM
MSTATPPSSNYTLESLNTTSEDILASTSSPGKAGGNRTDAHHSRTPTTMTVTRMSTLLEYVSSTAPIIFVKLTRIGPTRTANGTSHGISKRTTAERASSPNITADQVAMDQTPTSITVDEKLSNTTEESAISKRNKSDRKHRNTSTMTVNHIEVCE